MGTGYQYKCKKCGYEYGVFPGSGMGYPMVYRETIADIAGGKYGPELREAYNNTPYAAVDAGKAVFFCDGCNAWEVGIDLTLYAPNNPGKLAGKRFGIKTVAEWGYVPYVMPCDLEKDYHVVKPYEYPCTVCGKRMRKATEEELKNLPCPECGSANRAETALLWD